MSYALVAARRNGLGTGMPITFAEQSPTLGANCYGGSEGLKGLLGESLGTTLAP